MNIVFMGTPDFAVPCLQALIDEGHNIIGVYTQPDKPKGRGHKLMPPPVKELAIKHGIPVYHPVSVKKTEEIEAFKNLNADLCVVVAFGKILPKDILDAPKHGCINVHGSLLPLYRGAAPIQWSVIDGQKVTGITTMYLSQGMDEGDIILKQETEIGENETSGELFERLQDIGAKVLLQTVKLIENGTAPRLPQSETGIQPTYASMLSKEMSVLNFDKNAVEIHNLVRGLCPWPVAKTTVNGKNLKVFNTVIIDESYNDYNCGQLVCNKRFIIKCGNNTAIEFLEVQVDGKKRTSGADFIRGYRLEIGTKIGQ